MGKQEISLMTNVTSQLCACMCVFHQDAFCAEALDENMCLKNPECSWCEGRCREYQPTNPVKTTFTFVICTVEGWIAQINDANNFMFLQPPAFSLIAKKLLTL